MQHYTICKETYVPNHKREEFPGRRCHETSGWCVMSYEETDNTQIICDCCHGATIAEALERIDNNEDGCIIVDREQAKEIIHARPHIFGEMQLGPNL